MRIILDQTAKDIIGAEALDVASLKNASGCVAILDSAGRIIAHSDGVQAAFGSQSSSLRKGQAYWSVWPADTHKPLQRAISRGLDGEITQYWCRYEDEGGVVTYWDIRLSPLHDVQDQVGAVLAVARKLEEH